MESALIEKGEFNTGKLSLKAAADSTNNFQFYECNDSFPLITT